MCVAGAAFEAASAMLVLPTLLVIAPLLFAELLWSYNASVGENPTF
jgi:hypothetical protein